MGKKDRESIVLKDNFEGVELVLMLKASDRFHLMRLNKYDENV